MPARQVAIVLYPGMTALDAIGPYEVLRFAPDTEIRFVGHEVGPVVTDSGVLALGVTHTFAETLAPQIVVVPGGPAATAVAADTAVLDWLRAAHRTAEWTTSVCTGALVLAAAGLLDGKPATTHWAAQSALGLLGAQPRKQERVVRADARIVTAAGVSAGIDMALWLVAEIHGADRARTVQLDIEYDPRPPVDAGHPSKASSAVRRASMADQAKLMRALTAGELVRTVTGAQLALWRGALRRVRARIG
ncbi:DJ-1/PfpI family protein [Nocardia farcinica]|uniref:DJ-1/PfpI family protein n=1 Tax=Nocardia farcinica TaxID=37329 RepID=UPI000E08973B|nr:DJ-1/PfpI family protein [Nocardia farcinica]SUE32142.1 ThiJ/PfpI family protein [Nocardia farcinica]